MTETTTFSVEEIAPSPREVLAEQGVPPGKAVSPAVSDVCRKALDLLRRHADPRAIHAEIPAAEFGPVFEGEGRNEPRSPVGDIFARSDLLALFAVTLGEDISRSIDLCFRQNDPPLGAMLDSAASLSADRLAGALQDRLGAQMRRSGRANADAAVLRYSPGYCGWHVSGQKKLFDRLRPERIGITLNARYLMKPLKSVSGVILGGPADMHRVRDDYAFCGDCRHPECRDRLRTLAPADPKESA